MEKIGHIRRKLKSFSSKSIDINPMSMKRKISFDFDFLLSVRANHFTRNNPHADCGDVSGFLWAQTRSGRIVEGKKLNFMRNLSGNVRRLWFSMVEIETIWKFVVFYFYHRKASRGRTIAQRSKKTHKEIHKKQLKSSFFLLIISFVTFVSIFYDSQLVQ